MTAQQHPVVSAFTEITDTSRSGAYFAFARALVLGTLAGSAPAMIFIIGPFLTVLFDKGGFDPAAFSLFMLPVLVTGVITLVAMIVIGLPLTAVLARHDRECPRIYGLAGLVAGALIPFVICLAFGSWEAGLFFAVFGMLAGFGTALSWGRWRNSLQARVVPHDVHENPFHDMIY